MESYFKEKDFDYEDVMKAIKEIFENENITNIFEEFNLSVEDIIKESDDKLIEAIEGENLIEFTSRYLTFILVVNVCKKYVEEAKQKLITEKEHEALLNDKPVEEAEEPEEFSIKDTEFLKKISAAYMDGDFKSIINCIETEHLIPYELGDESIGEIKIAKSNEARFIAFIKSYQDDFNNEMEKIYKKYELSKEEVFSHTKSFYKSNIATSKKLNKEYIEKHPEDPKAFLIFKKESVSLEDFFETVRYYNQVNSHIIAVLEKGKIKLKVKDYENKQELLDAYYKLKNKNKGE